jgi:hypothetical protein
MRAARNAEEVDVVEGDAGTPGRWRLITRFALPVVGSVLLAAGGLWAVSVTQGAAEPAFNSGSASLYASMIVAYGLVAFGARAWRVRDETTAARGAKSAVEAILVGCAGSPALVLAGASYSCFVLDGCS